MVRSRDDLSMWLGLTIDSLVFGWARRTSTSSSVVNSEEPFAKAHGMNQFDYMRTHPEFLTQFKSAFEDSTPQFAKTMLSKYRGFAGVHTLVDVGGSSGMYLSFIVRKYPHIRGINFDLPEVVAQNPTFPGEGLT